MSKNTDVNGNALASQVAFTRELVKVGETLLRFDKTLERLDGEGVWVVSIKLRAPTDDTNTWLAVTHARVNGEGKVGFHGGDSIFETLKGVLGRLESGHMKWKDDLYA